jgi:hypothetical protein
LRDTGTNTARSTKILACPCPPYLLPASPC